MVSLLERDGKGRLSFPLRLGLGRFESSRQ
jgi:hypothetical protein